jgi:hypothetical protein
MQTHGVNEMPKIDVTQLTLAAQAMAPIANTYAYQHKLKRPYEMLLEANRAADFSPAQAAELINKFREYFAQVLDIEGMDRVIGLVERAVMPTPPPPVLEQRDHLYSNRCTLLGLQKLAVEVSGKTTLPAKLWADHRHNEIVFLSTKAWVTQFVIQQPADRRMFWLFPCECVKIENPFENTEWCGFHDIGFIWQWPDGSILLAVKFFQDEIELMFRPAVNADGWFNTGDWLQDGPVVRRHREFFVDRAKRWEPTAQMEADELAKCFGDTWMDLVNPDYLRAFHQGYIQALAG